MTVDASRGGPGDRRDRWDRYAAFVQRRRIAILLIAAILTGLGGWLASHLELKTDFGELLPRRARAVRELERIQTRFAGLSTLVVAIDGGDWKKREAYAEEVVATIKSKVPQSHVNFVDYKVSDARAFFDRNRFLYVDLGDLQEILKRLKLKVADATSRQMVVDLEDSPPYKFQVDDILKKYESRAADYDHFPDGYFITPDRTLQALLLRLPSSALGGASSEEVISEVRQAVELTHPNQRGYRILIGGDPVTAREERDGVVNDLMVVSVSSVVLVVLAIVLFFRSKLSIFLIGIPVGVGVSIAFGVARLTIGSLNSNTAFLGSIIVGNGINFGIILLARYLEERRAGSTAHTALTVALRRTWLATATAATAASLAYGSLMVTDFRGFSQFGFIGGMGMLLCWAATFTVTPALISTFEALWPTKSGGVRPVTPSAVGWISRVLGKYHRAIGAVGIVVSLASVIGAAMYYRDPFEYDFRKLRSRRAVTSGSSALGRRVDKIFNGTKMMAGSPSVILVDRPDQVQPLVDALEARKKAGAWIDRAESLVGFLPTEQPAKLEVMREIRELLDKKVVGVLNAQQQKDVDKYRPPTDARAIGVDDLPEMLRRPFTERDGRHGLIVYVYPPPGTDYLDGRLLLKFSDAIREVKLPSGEKVNTSGNEIILADILGAVLRDGPLTTLASFVGVLVLVIITVRRTRDRVVVMGTLLCGVFWLCGVGALFGIKVNMLNFVALPITFGIGVEYPVNLYRRYVADQPADLGRAIWNTGGAVALCSLTTIIGYGSLLFADTRALNSFGLLAVLGELTTLTAALVWMPAILWLDKSRKS